jgi:precorrin-6A/cobalt-precorrin-6A reductase
MHVLVLGGTGEALELARRLSARPYLRVTYALAGRTRAPALPGCAVRVGGFGGAAGLAAWLATERVEVIVDATHPFAAAITASATGAAAAAGIALVRLRRPTWSPGPGDRWTSVPDIPAAAAALGAAPRRVFLAIGRQEIAAFRAAPQHHYLVRSIEPVAPEALPPLAETLLGRGPFPEAEERRLLTAHRIDTLVAKNSGGDATYGKLAAARSLGLPVVIVARPPAPDAVATVEAALAEIERHLAALPADRGV